MRRSTRIRFLTLTIALLGLATTAMAFDGHTVTFDDGTEGWTANPDLESILDDGGEHGPYWNFTNVDQANDVTFLRGWYSIWNDTDPAFIGDYTEKGEVRISIDVDLDFYDLYNWGSWMQVDEYREVAIELRDYDNPYTDPDTGYSWPWKAVQFMAGYLPHRDDGWATYYADVTDVRSDEVPTGWIGFGGPENPVNYFPQLPPDTTWTQFLEGVDEVRITSLAFGWFYSLNFRHGINADNLSITEIPRICNGMQATIYVNNDNIVVGGQFDGMNYNGVLHGTDSDDVIVGTGSKDTINGRFGNDVICGMGGNDNINGQDGSDFIDGGEGDDNLVGHNGDDFIHGGDGEDHVNCGAGHDTCIAAELLNGCEPDSTSGGGRLSSDRISDDRTSRSGDRIDQPEDGNRQMEMK
jgi:hypothetical protein